MINSWASWLVQSSRWGPQEVETCSSLFTVDFFATVIKLKLRFKKTSLVLRRSLLKMSQVNSVLETKEIIVQLRLVQSLFFDEAKAKNCWCYDEMENSSWGINSWDHLVDLSGKRKHKQTDKHVWSKWTLLDLNSLRHPRKDGPSLVCWPLVETTNGRESRHHCEHIPSKKYFSSHTYKYPKLSSTGQGSWMDSSRFHPENTWDDTLVWKPKKWWYSYLGVRSDIQGRMDRHWSADLWWKLRMAGKVVISANRTLREHVYYNNYLRTRVTSFELHPCRRVIFDWPNILLKERDSVQLRQQRRYSTS